MKHFFPGHIKRYHFFLIRHVALIRNFLTFDIKSDGKFVFLFIIHYYTLCVVFFFYWIRWNEICSAQVSAFNLH